MRNVHTIGSGKVNSRPVILAGDAIHTEDGLLARSTTPKMTKHTRRNAVISAKKGKVDPPDLIAFASEEIDGEPTLYELEMGKMADVANVSEPKEDKQEDIKKSKQEDEPEVQAKVNTVIERARAKDMKRNKK